ncbi:hypothetical protein [Paraburkholderia lycopersici]|nr:hypothetical protein [Paraburkholderia lycopersici]
MSDINHAFIRCGENRSISFGADFFDIDPCVRIRGATSVLVVKTWLTSPSRIKNCKAR